MSNEADKLIELAQQLFPQPKVMPKIYTKGWSQPGFPEVPKDESALPPNALIIELMPLTAPERRDADSHVGARTYGEPPEPGADQPEAEDKLAAMLKKMADGTAGL